MNNNYLTRRIIDSASRSRPVVVPPPTTGWDLALTLYWIGIAILLAGTIALFLTL